MISDVITRIWLVLSNIKSHKRSRIDCHIPMALWLKGHRFAGSACSYARRMLPEVKRTRSSDLERLLYEAKIWVRHDTSNGVSRGPSFFQAGTQSALVRVERLESWRVASNSVPQSIHYFNPWQWVHRAWFVVWFSWQRAKSDRLSSSREQSQWGHTSPMKIPMSSNFWPGRSRIRYSILKIRLLFAIRADILQRSPTHRFDEHKKS